MWPSSRPCSEIVFFDRSWYNRAGVERVMDFCTTEQYEHFLRQAPQFERMLVEDGVLLVKFWFSVSRSEQRTRFAIRQVDPVRQWKLSPTDLASLDLWDEYTAAKVEMFRATDTECAPWTVVKNNDKKRGLGWRRCAVSCGGSTTTARTRRPWAARTR